MREKSFVVKVKTSNLPISIIGSQAIMTRECSFVAEAEVWTEDQDTTPIFEKVRVSSIMEDSSVEKSTIGSVGYALGKPKALERVESKISEAIEGMSCGEINLFHDRDAAMTSIANDVLDCIRMEIQAINSDWSFDGPFSKAIEKAAIENDVALDIEMVRVQSLLMIATVKVLECVDGGQMVGYETGAANQNMREMVARVEFD